MSVQWPDEMPEGATEEPAVRVEAFPYVESGARVTSLATGLDALVQAFDAGRDRPRLVGIFGPT